MRRSPPQKTPLSLQNQRIWTDRDGIRQEVQKFIRRIHRNLNMVFVFNSYEASRLANSSKQTYI